MRGRSIKSAICIFYAFSLLGCIEGPRATYLYSPTDSSKTAVNTSIIWMRMTASIIQNMQVLGSMTGRNVRYD